MSVSGPEYQSAFARALPKDLSLKLPKTDSWYETAKWMELLFALLPICGGSPWFLFTALTDFDAPSVLQRRV